METNERVIATVRVNRQDVAVRILSVFRTGDGRRVASVEALPENGFQPRPFTQYSIGGPSQSATANIRLEFLRGISRVTEPAPAPQPEPAKPVLGIVRVDGQDIEVEVKRVYTTEHGEKIAEVHARSINGRQPTPFNNISCERGNPWTATARIPVSEILGLSLVNEGA